MMTIQHLDPATVWGIATAMLAAVTGWFLRGVKLASSWGALQAEVHNANERMAALDAAFRHHLDADRESQAAHDLKITEMHGLLHQLIGEVRAMRRASGAD